MTMLTDGRWRVVGVVGLVLVLYGWTVMLLRSGWGGDPGWTLIDGVNLLVHEAGHVAFLALGEGFMFVGGSLLQCLLPGIFGYYFWKRRDWVGSLFSSWWLGTNLVYVGHYIGDARARALPLLSEGANHDWHYLLSRWNLLEYDRVIGGIVYGMGWVVMVGSLVGLSYLVLRMMVNRVDW